MEKTYRLVTAAEMAEWAVDHTSATTWNLVDGSIRIVTDPKLIIGKGLDEHYARGSSELRSYAIDRAELVAIFTEKEGAWLLDIFCRIEGVELDAWRHVRYLVTPGMKQSLLAVGLSGQALDRRFERLKLLVKAAKLKCSTLLHDDDLVVVFGGLQLQPVSFARHRMGERGFCAMRRLAHLLGPEASQGDAEASITTAEA